MEQTKNDDINDDIVDGVKGIHKFGFGDLLKHRIHGFTGEVTSIADWVNNCARYTLQPRELKDGKPIEAMAFDVVDLELVEAAPERKPLPQPRSSARLGDEVEDALTDAAGTVIAICYINNGCVRYFVQSRTLHKGKPADLAVLDDIHTRVKKTATEAPTPVKTGGPRAEPKARY